MRESAVRREGGLEGYIRQGNRNLLQSRCYCRERGNITYVLQPSSAAPAGATVTVPPPPASYSVDRSDPEKKGEGGSGPCLLESRFTWTDEASAEGKAIRCTTRATTTKSLTFFRCEQKRLGGVVEVRWIEDDEGLWLVGRRIGVKEGRPLKNAGDWLLKEEPQPLEGCAHAPFLHSRAVRVPVKSGSSHTVQACPTLRTVPTAGCTRMVVRRRGG